MKEAVILEKVIAETGNRKDFQCRGKSRAQVLPSSGREPVPGRGTEPLCGTRLSTKPEALVSALPSKNRNLTVKATEGEEVSRADVTACGLPFTQREW